MANLTEEQIGKIITGQIIALLSDSKYSHQSKVHPRYCTMYNHGREIVDSLIDLMIPELAEIAHNKNLETAKELFINTLEGKKDD